ETYFEEGSYSEAVKNFEKIVNDHSKSDVLNEANYYAGECHFELGDNNKAESFYNAVINSQKPIFKDYAYYSLGWTLLAQNRHSEAIAAFKSLMQNYPQSDTVPDAKFKLGETYWRNEDFQLAVDTITEIIDHPDNVGYRAAGYYFLGDAYYELENLTKSREYFKKVTDEFPDSNFANEALIGLGWILYNEENYTEAAIIYARLVQNSGPGEIFEQSKYLWGLSLNKSEQI
ncbi:MAG: tetratricopeptide repeat protein, partial [bacterium]|nr:tetratricopeptide repeat protein [bacterium]